MKVFFFSVGFFFSTGIPLQEIFSPRNQAALQDNFFWNHLLIPPSKVKGSAPYYRLNSTEIQVTVLKITDFPHSQDNEITNREFGSIVDRNKLAAYRKFGNDAIQERIDHSLLFNIKELSAYSVITSEGYRATRAIVVLLWLSVK